MKNIVARVLLVIMLCCSIVGCTTVEHTTSTTYSKQTISAGFNEEQYIWEHWVFPTNKTTGR